MMFMRLCIIWRFDQQYQKFGNPQLLTSALNLGVKVIVAHCASLGSNLDLDFGSQRKVSNFQLFMRMMDNERWNVSAFVV